jgi:serine/threonine-protein kinase
MATIPCIRCGAQIEREFKACPHCGEPLTDFLREYADKPIDGKYRIVQRLGIGGMGEVFKVEHTFLGSTRVVKIIRAQISASSDAHERFLREARLATKVQHPNVATLYDFSELADGSHYMVWEFIEGQNLAQVLKQRGTLAPRHTVRIAIQALAGLEAIHRAGIVHRDISPENLMITHAGDSSEFVKIIDLGVAKAAESDVAMTQTGMFVGKFRYASPDHLGFLPDGERIDGRADLYSLGVVLFEMVTGRPPFEATSPHEYIIHHSRDEYASSPDLDRITGNPALQKVLARALDRDRNKRFATAREFSDALAAIEATLPDEPPAAPALFDADATMKTERTKGGQIIVPAAAATSTVITSTPPLPTMAAPVMPQATVPATPAPLPLPTVAASPTVVDPMPMPPAAPRRNTGTIIAVSIIVLLLLGAMGVAGVMVFLKFRNTFSGTSPATTASTTTTMTSSATAKPSQTSVDVTPPASVLVDTATTSAATTTTAPVTTSSVAVVPPPTATHAVVKPKPPVVEEPAPLEETAAPEPQPEPEPASSTVATFRERGDSGSNDAAIAALHQQIAGTTRIAVSGGDAEMINELANALRSRGISIGEGAPIEIRFTGSVSHHGLGRKSRSANATVKKNGRPIFNYVMPREDYRVGDSPAEAFARILTDALAR